MSNTPYFNKNMVNIDNKDWSVNLNKKIMNDAKKRTKFISLLGIVRRVLRETSSRIMWPKIDVLRTNRVAAVICGKDTTENNHTI